MRFWFERSTDRRVGLGWARRVVGQRFSEDVSDDYIDLFSSPGLVQTLSQFRPLLSLCEVSEQYRSLFTGSPIRKTRPQPVHHCGSTA
jgi:hypothetical protein